METLWTHHKGEETGRKPFKMENNIGKKMEKNEKKWLKWGEKEKNNCFLLFFLKCHFTAILTNFDYKRIKIVPPSKISEMKGEKFIVGKMSAPDI